MLQSVYTLDTHLNVFAYNSNDTEANRQLRLPDKQCSRRRVHRNSVSRFRICYSGKDSRTGKEVAIKAINMKDVDN